MQVALRQTPNVSNPSSRTTDAPHRPRRYVGRSRRCSPTGLCQAGGLQSEYDAVGLISACLGILIASSNLSSEQQKSRAEVDLSRSNDTFLRRSANRVTDLDWGASADVGPRDSMEDSYQVMKGSDHLFASVYDGHGGSGSSAYLRLNFYKFINTVLGKNRKLFNEGKAGDVSADIEKMMSDTFSIVDSALIDHIAGLGDPECWSGSTATVCLICSSLLVCANVGDSKAVLCRRGKPIDLSAEHRPTTATTCGRGEIKRVNTAGGWVSQSRVCGILAVTRAFGDYEFKGGRYELLEELQKGNDRQSIVATMESPPVISTPHCFTVNRSTEDEFVILATDGLWDTMNSAQAVTFVRAELKKNPALTMQDVSNALVARALRCRTQDNVACVVVKLNR